jgi:hypothetical protein
MRALNHDPLDGAMLNSYSGFSTKRTETELIGEDLSLTSGIDK